MVLIILRDDRWSALINPAASCPSAAGAAPANLDASIRCWYLTPGKDLYHWLGGDLLTVEASRTWEDWSGVGELEVRGSPSVCSLRL